MKHFNNTLSGLLFTSALVSTSLVFAATAKEENNGVIVFRNANNDMCNIIMPPAGTRDKVYRLVYTDGSHCGFDEIRSWSIFDVPSATTITLSSNRFCETGNNAAVWFKLRTTGKKTDTPIRELKTLGDYLPLKFVNSGLQMLERRVTENITDKIACMKITTSAKPPVSDGLATP